MTMQLKDKVAVITLRGREAELALPPTSSVDIAARRLRALRTGGKTPLAEGLLLVAITFAACFAGYEAIRRIGVLRPLFGLKRKADTRASASASLAATDA